jgi:hypothetical protein
VLVQVQVQVQVQVLVLVPVPVPVLVARWLALLVLLLEAQRPVRPDLGSNPPQGPH